MKQREILTYPLTREQIWAEFRHFLEYFQAKGVEEGSVLLGHAWALEYYSENEWIPAAIPLAELETRIQDLEQRGLGELGSDDLFVELGGVEFRFCHEMDVHLGFDEHHPVIEDFYARWDRLGYHPAEWIKNQKIGPGTWVRGAKPDA